MTLHRTFFGSARKSDADREWFVVFVSDVCTPRVNGANTSVPRRPYTLWSREKPESTRKTGVGKRAMFNVFYAH